MEVCVRVRTRICAFFFTHTRICTRTYTWNQSCPFWTWLPNLKNMWGDSESRKFPILWTWNKRHFRRALGCADLCCNTLHPQAWIGLFYACILAYYSCMRECTHTHTHTRACVLLMHAWMHTYTHTHVCLHITHACVNAHIYTHTRVLAYYSCMRDCTHIHTHTCARVLRMHACVWLCSRILHA